ncbi:hypothetical protein [Phytohabitans rumicis]|uniref:Uncharacterized protein n=1 Tax=Phytohabitans rumicis TaxID=1076125 RepID=A0A6V8LDH7_9ACTN|nr:hypothetical protein [Phytohabitans rumicis]GFJ95283.1 hypothetical protein Prum_089250 [Phytohabitans rumicis]
MNCPVCHGTGISPASSHPYAMREGLVLNCGACHGTGVYIRSSDEDDDDDLGRDADLSSGAVEAADAFRRHAPDFGGIFDRLPTFHKPPELLTDVELMLELSRIDRRASEALLGMVGGASADTVESLDGIIEDLKRLGRDDQRDVKKRLADTTKMLARALADNGELIRAEHAYTKAGWFYEDLDLASEIADCADRRSEVRFAQDRDVDARLAYLGRKLDRVTDPLDVAETHVDIAELHGAGGDEYEATAHFRAAERVVAPLADQATGAAMADALMSSMMALMSGETTPSGQTPVVEANRIRALLRQVYGGLARVLPEPEASRYRRKGDDLDGSIAQGSQDNIDFSRRMSESLGDIFDQLNRRQHGDQ